MEVILFHPEIPQNTGNIARTCVVTKTSLTLVRPLGFSLTARQIKRSGMDYWDEVNLKLVDSLDEILTSPFYFFSTKATKLYTDVSFSKEAKLIFGSESAGLPLVYHEKWTEHFYKIPMKEGSRSLNLSNSVAIVLYEALRQLRFEL